MIEVKGLKKRFGIKTALDAVEVTFDSGIYGLLGPNGAGKTTLLRTLLGLYPIQSGDVFYDGKSLRKSNDLAQNAGYLPQRFGMFYELTVQGVMAYIGTMKKMPMAQVRQETERCLARTNLSELKDRKVGALSGGMLRRLGIAQTLLGDPDVLIFDEPTAGLDPEERMRFKNIVADIRRDHTVIISTHIVDDVDALCDQVVVMMAGKVAFTGTRQQLKAVAEKKVYEIPVEKQALLSPGAFLGNRFEREGTDYIRILSTVPQPAGVLVPPNIEDGYLCITKGM
ncbi:ATP-binding cassette domain-containing protein [Neobittarella massiliensis]|uniref:ATP-binding cassette domain-containing protein n=2 Tax=Oscillospiraceae TaxID=216572 RepID=A0A8J6IFJ7_9FIRM|nr:ATP-binding cassette domain-containing protein [Neobittarella massiliensis]MBC3516230.1 ATP-binding cassette domain-containing protein [Neobittarella massiliensis]SCJ86229.1 Lipopolysaccharide export system ATP-binding protein LptB [uncultured Anaerotruncus sp.]